jgi:hypothetical protein
MHTKFWPRWEYNIKMDVIEILRELDSCGSGWVPVAGTCEQSDEPSRSIKGGQFLEYLSEYYLLKKDSAPWSY